MASEWRRVEVAPGHKLLAMRVASAAVVNDRVLVSTKRRGRVYMPAARWNAAEIHRG